MANEREAMQIIGRIITDDADGCMMCNSHDHLVYCDLGEDWPRLLCKSCRDEYLYDDDGNLKEDELNELFDNYDWEALAREEDEEMSSKEAAFVRAILG